MLSDIEIARQVKPRPLREVAEELAIPSEALLAYGHTKAKVDVRSLSPKKEGRIVLVTAISPTPAGEGKTTTTIGLADALRSLGHSTMVCLREPSMGPVFGMKGGATGGGHAQVIPMEEINLHFTGDLHAIGAANNLIAACLDNHMYWGNEPKLDLDRILWRRVVDMNDRSLRNIQAMRGFKKDRYVYETGFDITVASEIMAVFCLAKDRDDLKRRLGEIIVAFTEDDEAFRVSDLGIEGSLAVLLDQAIDPNLVQTLEGTPAFIHGGPFANIAHGCNSLIATKSAAQLVDIVITEAGFGADLGAEKFLHLKAPQAEIWPSAAVVVATIRALKHHGGAVDLASPNPEAVRRGLPNLLRHLEIMRNFGLPTVVALNHFATDTGEELAVVESACAELGIRLSHSKVFAEGSSGGHDLAHKVLETMEEETEPKSLYSRENTIEEKLQILVDQVYGGRKVIFSDEALVQAEEIVALGYGDLPVCVAKTPNSFTDDPKILGAPENFDLHIKELRLRAGAGFIVCLAGSIMTMPGLSKIPQARSIDLVGDEIVGLS